VIRNTAIINGVSLEPHKLDTMLPLVQEYGTDVVAFLLYPNGRVPPDAAERMRIAVEMYQQIETAGINPERLIIDPVVVPVSWQNGLSQAMAVLEVIRRLPDLLGFPVRTIAGLSNLTSGYGNRDKKRLLERTYLTMLYAAGLDIVLLDVMHAQTVRTAQACKVLGGDGIFTWECL
jgi:5-methyltetrahydrofolate corrinoid/iron sulfur protein methyltransferase